jgi:hypothetical protein
MEGNFCKTIDFQRNCHMKVLHTLAKACLLFFFMIACCKAGLVARINQLKSMLYLDSKAPIDQRVYDPISFIRLKQNRTVGSKAYLGLGGIDLPPCSRCL